VTSGYGSSSVPLARSDVEIARSTLGDWLAQSANLLVSLYQLLHRLSRQAKGA
jgi:hypothetical protein